MRSPRIAEMPAPERPREKLAALGPASLTDSELLAIFLRVGTVGCSSVDLGRLLLDRHGNLAGLAACGVAELSRTRGVGLAKAAQLAAAFELGRRFALEKARNIAIEDPEAVYNLLAPEMRALQQESLRVVLLNTKLHLLAIEEVTRGTLNECLAHPREILRRALIHAAYAFILVHNHPSGDPTPSQADRELTRRIARVSVDLGVQFQDHVIIGAPGDHGEPYFSFREFGLL